MSSLAREAYISTYSWPESDMSAYITSSVTERRMNRSSSKPSYREKSSGSPNRTPTLRSRGRTVPGGWIS